MLQKRIRTIAIAVIRRGDDVFVFEGIDPATQQSFYRPLGGAIEFSEYGRQAVAREFKEEIGATIEVGRYLGAIENIFVYDGETGHEIALVYEATFTDASFYEQPEVKGEDDGNVIFRALWMPLDHFRQGLSPLYPTGLLDWLQ